MKFLHNLNVVARHPLNRGREVQAVWNWVLWQAYRRTAPGPIVFDWMDGVRFLVRRDEDSMLGNVYNGLAEPEAMSFALNVIRPGDMFIDVGANVGAFTLICCGAGKASGVCFEPVPSTFRRLIDNLNLNDLRGRVQPFNLGVSDPPSRILRFTSSGDSINHVVTEGEEGSNVVEISTVTLDDHVSLDRPALLKIDVEGFEVPVLRGARRLLESGRIYAAIVEINEFQDRYGHSASEALSLLSAAGYHPASYESDARALHPITGTNAREDSTIFVRDFEFANLRLRESRPVAICGRKL